MPAEISKLPAAREEIHKEIIESYIFSTVRHDFGIYSQRLLLRLVELAQREVLGLSFKDGTDIGKVQIGEWGGAEIIIPVRDILSGETDNNYTKAKEAVRNLMGKFLEYEDEKNYKATHILDEVDVDKIDGKIVISVNRNIWSSMLDFSKGFRKYELETAMKLRGKYTLRIYKLICNQTEPISFTIEELRRMWSLEDKYKRLDDFVSHTIEAAKKELDEISSYSFEYALIASKTAEVNRGRKGRKSYTSVKFFPKHRVNNVVLSDVLKRVDPSMLFGREISQLLRDKFGFDWPGIKANIALFDCARKEFDLLEFLYKIAPQALRADNPQGYVVNAVKKHLKEYCGISFENGIINRTNLMSPRHIPSIELKPLSEIMNDLNADC